MLSEAGSGLKFCRQLRMLPQLLPCNGKLHRAESLRP